MPASKLTDTAIKTLKLKNKPYKVSDGTIGGMFIAVSPKGKKVFRFAYKFQGKGQLLTLGVYPDVTLMEARDLAREARKQLAQGINPAAAKKADKGKENAETTTFRFIAGEWLLFRQGNRMNQTSSATNNAANSQFPNGYALPWQKDIHPLNIFESIFENTIPIVSWLGIPCSNGKNRLRKSIFALPNSSIST
jgi:hypothetical protein